MTQRAQLKFRRFYFFPISWAWEDKEVINNKNKELYTIIKIFGLNEKNEGTYIRVEDFTVPVIVELDKDIAWNDAKVQVVASHFRSMTSKKYCPASIEFQMKKRLYYANLELIPEKERTSQIKYRDKLFPYLIVNFNSQKAMESFTYMLKKDIVISGLGLLKFKAHTGDKRIDPVMKLCGIRKLPTMNWIVGKGIKKEGIDKESLKKNEYAVSYKDLSGMEESQQLKMPIVYPKVMAFDIEVNSTNIRRMPKYDQPGDKTFQISTVILDPPNVGSTDRVSRKFLHSLGNPDPEIVGKDTQIRLYHCEGDLNVGLSKQIVEEDVDVIIGYNIFGFDLPYLWDRSNEICMCIHDFNKMGCIEGYCSSKEKVEWSSSAYGKQDYWTINADGRLFLDLLPYIKNKLMIKLPNYRLETICEEYLKTGKDPLKPKDIFRKYREGTPKSLGEVGHYCVVDSVVCILLFQKFMIWPDLTESATTNKVQGLYIYTKGQQIKMYSQMYEYCYHENIVVESNAFSSGENEHYTGAYVSDPIKGLYNRILPFDFCLTGDTLITMSNNTSKRLRDIKVGDNVVGFKDNGFDNFKVTGFKNVGVKDTVKIWLEDGTTITSTPDHKFLTSDKEWVRADTLKDKKVICGLEYAEDIEYINDDEWDMEINNVQFDLRENREKSLAFSRMLGYILSDGCIYIKKSNREKKAEAYFGTMIDAKNFMTDVRLFCNRDIAIRKRIYEPGSKRAIKGVTYTISIPKYLTDIIFSIKGIIIGKRAIAPMTLPEFLFDSKCPVPIIKEFLSGLYGGDGTAPFIASKGIGGISLKWTTIEKYKENMVEIFQKISHLHHLFDIYPTFPNPIKVNYSEKSIKPKDYIENPRWDIQIGIKVDDIEKFQKMIGFSYCVNKSCRSTAFYSYNKLCSNIRKQYNETMDKTMYLIDKNIGNTLSRSKKQPTFKECINQAIKETFENEPIIHNDSILTQKKLLQYRGEIKRHPERKHKTELKTLKLMNYIENIGAKSWFKYPGDNKKMYAVKTDDVFIPYYEKKVIDVRPQGNQEVFDIEVEGSHSFLANGVVVHNCSLYPSIMRAYNIDYSKLVADSAIPDEDCYIHAWDDHKNCDHDPKKKVSKRPSKSTKPKKVVCASYKYRFLKQSVGGKGVVPILLERCIDARKATRKQIASNNLEIAVVKKILNSDKISSEDLVSFFERLVKYEKDITYLKDNSIITKWKEQKEVPLIGKDDIHLDLAKSRIQNLEDINVILDKRQNAYKINANSMYGAMGVKKGTLPFLPGAMCVTYIGRESILKANKFIESTLSGKVIYNDTDSSYCHFDHLEQASVKDIWNFCHQAEDKIEKIFPPPMRMEFEDVSYENFLILTKKRYCGYKMDKDGIISNKLAKKGIVLQRRDNCKCLRDTYELTLHMIFKNIKILISLKGKDRDEILKNEIVRSILATVIEKCNELFVWKYPYKDFVVTKQMAREKYIGKRIPAHVYLAQKMVNRGTPMGVGSRIEYLLLDNGAGYKKVEIQQDKIEDVMYFSEFRDILRIDYVYYFKTFIKPLDELLKVSIGIEDFIKNHYKLRVMKWNVISRIKQLFKPKIDFIDEPMTFIDESEYFNVR